MNFHWKSQTMDNGMAREDFDQIFSVGALRGALAYKKCGMGLKVALANADPENLSWEIRTKTTNGECSYIGAPYAEQMAFESLNPKELKSLRRSGTIIRRCSRAAFLSADRKARRVMKNGLRCWLRYCGDLCTVASEGTAGRGGQSSQYSVAMGPAAWPGTDH